MTVQGHMHGHLGGEHTQNSGGRSTKCDFTQGHTTVERRNSSRYGCERLHRVGRLHGLVRYGLLSQKNYDYTLISLRERLDYFLTVLFRMKDQ